MWFKVKGQGEKAPKEQHKSGKSLKRHIPLYTFTILVFYSVWTVIINLTCFKIELDIQGCQGQAEKDPKEQIGN